jgi:hypothetical protein
MKERRPMTVVDLEPATRRMADLIGGIPDERLDGADAVPFVMDLECWPVEPHARPPARRACRYRERREEPLCRRHVGDFRPRASSRLPL